MITYKCLVNGPISEPTRQRVVAGLRSIYADRFGITPAQMTIDFTEIEPGMWFTGGVASRASMVLGSVPAGITQPARVALMARVCRMFSDVTGAPYDDVMVVAADPRPDAGA